MHFTLGVVFVEETVKKEFSSEQLITKAMNKF